MAEKSIKRNYIYNLMYQILLLITPLITTPYLSRVLGADGIGKYSYIESICSYFVLFATLGLTTFGQREVSYVQNDLVKRTTIFWETNIIELIASIICCMIYIIFSLQQKDSPLYLALIFNLLAVIVNITWFFQGLEEFGKIVLRNIIFKLINIIFVFVCIKSKDDLIFYLFGTACITFLSNVSLWIEVPKYITKISISKLHPLRHMKTVISLFVPTIAVQVYTVLDKTMIGMITQNDFENGYYEQAVKISKMVMTVVTALGTVMIPRIGFYFEKGDVKEVKRLMYRGYRFVWFLGIPLCLGLIMVSPKFVPWFFGEGYNKVSVLLGILSFLILAIGINNVTGIQYLIPTKRQNIFTLTVLIGAMINFAMNYILIERFAAIGAAIASVTAETVIAIVQLMIVRKEINPLEVLKEGANYWIAGGIMTGVLFFIQKLVSASIMGTVALVAVGASSYFVVLFFMKDEFLLTNLNKILRR